MEYPHINDDKFPNINTVDVWKFQNNFDYARWQGKISIKLLNVLWNSNYADVPGFVSDEERDKWFDKQQGLIHTLESGFNITPENTVRIPVPYNDAYRFNYLVVDMPMQTSANEPIDYEMENTRVQRWYYFIDNMTQYSPNTTELHLTLDVWVTFSNTVEIPYLMLERGHAPMMQTTASSFLQNPIENNEYLLAEDFNYGNENRIVKNTVYTPIGNGRKYVLFAVPMTQADLLLVGGADFSGNSTPPTYADTSERWGYQIVVNDYLWKYGKGDYSNAKLPISAFLNEDSVFNGNIVFAIKSESASSFFNVLQNNCVHLLHAIQGVFVVSEDMIKLGSAFTFKGFTLYQADKLYDVDNFSLTKEKFEFGSKYDEIAKLYTYPYSVLEITDDNGYTSEVRIENTGKIQLHKEISIAFPFVRYQCFFTGLNGNKSQTYTWKNLANSNVQKTMWEDDFSSFMMNWDIPTYAVYVSQENEYAVNNFASMQARRMGAIVTYENAVRYANTTYENVDDETNTMNANTATQNAANATITHASAVTSVQNTLTGNVASNQNAQHNITKLNADVSADLGFIGAMTGLQNDVLSTSTTLNNACNIDMTGVGGIANSFTGGPAGIANGIGNVIGACIQANTATATTGLIVGSNISQALNYGGTNAIKVSNAEANIRAVTTTTNDANTEIVDRTQETQIANTATQNAANTSITGATTATMDSNADWTRDATIEASKSNLVQAQREAEAQYRNHRLGTPVLETGYSGDAYPDVFERRGIRMNIRTQTKAAIAQVGDAFLRYGYALHRAWDMSDGFHYGKHFTFWKAEDIWINEGNGLSGNAVNIIGEILLKGVTVWKNPEEIGKVSIYDNI